MRGAQTLLVSVMAIVVAGAGCASSPDDEPSEAFRLTQVGGQPLPVSCPEEDGCEVFRRN